jgi:hypothetical protein
MMKKILASHRDMPKILMSFDIPLDFSFQNVKTFPLFKLAVGTVDYLEIIV